MLQSSLAWLARARSFAAIVAALAMLLALPALGAGWGLDDYYHRTVMLASSPFRALFGPPSEMFRFFRGDQVRTGRIMHIGVFPWWTDPTLKAEFLQAVTVLTHRLDYALWPESPVLMHAQSLVWLGTATAMAAVAVFYRRMLGPKWVAAVAAILYPVDDARGPTVGFIANRNVLVAATFGVRALICQDRWRRGGSLAAAVIASLLLAVALFSKEEGIGTCAYLAAYGLFADPASRGRGCIALSPYPVSATLSADRLLTFVGIGASGLLAQYFAFAFSDGQAHSPRRRWQFAFQGLAWLFIIVHAVCAPIALPIRSRRAGSKSVSTFSARWARQSQRKTW